jgi:hypothetical protein
MGGKCNYPKNLTTTQTITKCYESKKTINTSKLDIKWKPFEELFKSKTTPEQPNPGNQSSIEE